MKVTSLLKKLPIDFGQAEMRENTKGKLIGFSFIPSVNQSKALDVGCREGYWSEKLKKKGYNVESIDIEPHYALAKTVDVNEGLPYDDNSFDVVWCSEVIEHLESPKEAVNDMVRVLKPSGRLVITTPNSYFWIIRSFSILGKSPKKLQNPGHLHFFSIKSLRRILPKKAKVYGFFPYFLVKKRISSWIGLLSPTFVITLKKV